jgi:hypothetical protein
MKNWPKLEADSSPSNLINFFKENILTSLP